MHSSCCSRETPRICPPFFSFTLSPTHTHTRTHTHTHTHPRTTRAQCFEYADCQGHTRAVRPGGHEQRVAFDDAPRFAREVVNFRLYESWSAGQEVRRGLATIVPVDLMNLWTWRDLERMVAGDPSPDIARLKSKVKYDGIDSSAPEVKMLWDMLEDFSAEDRSRFLLFVWGRSRLPFSDTWEPAFFKVRLALCVYCVVWCVPGATAATAVVTSCPARVAALLRVAPSSPSHPAFCAPSPCASRADHAQELQRRPELGATIVAHVLLPAGLAAVHGCGGGAG